MKEQKQFMVCFGVIALISLFLSLLLEFEWDRYFVLWWEDCFTGHRPFIVNLSIGIGTGALLAFLTAWINYISAKDKFIAEFSEMCEDFCVALHKLPYLYFEADANLWATYYNEIERNKHFPNGTGECGAAYTNLLSWYKSQYPQSDPEQRLNSRKKKIDDELNSVFNSYYEFSGFNFCAIERIMKTYSFIRHCSKQEKRIQEIFTYVKDSYGRITSIVEYMRAFDTSNNVVIQIDSLQAKIFGNVQKSETTVFLPPPNKMETHIKNLLIKLNDRKGAKNNAKPTP